MIRQINEIINNNLVTNIKFITRQMTREIAEKINTAITNNLSVEEITLEKVELRSYDDDESYLFYEITPHNADVCYFYQKEKITDIDIDFDFEFTEIYNVFTTKNEYKLSKNTPILKVSFNSKTL